MSLCVYGRVVLRAPLFYWLLFTCIGVYWSIIISVSVFVFLFEIYSACCSRRAIACHRLQMSISACCMFRCAWLYVLICHCWMCQCALIVCVIMYSSYAMLCHCSIRWSAFVACITLGFVWLRSCHVVYASMLWCMLLCRPVFLLCMYLFMCLCRHSATYPCGGVLFWWFTHSKCICTQQYTFMHLRIIHTWILLYCMTCKRRVMRVLCGCYCAAFCLHRLVKTCSSSAVHFLWAFAQLQS